MKNVLDTLLSIKMSEHDDALLDDDFASLPDINDEEYDLDSSNDDATISTQESLNEQLSCDLKSSLEDILDLTDLDALEEFEKNTVVEPKANTFVVTNIKQENVKTEFSSEDNYGIQFNDKVILPIDENNLPEDNCSSETRCRTAKQFEPNRQKYKNIHTNVRTNETEYQQIQSLERECSSHHFDSCGLNKNHSYIQPMNYGPSFYQPYFQDERVHLGLNNSPFLSEPYPDRLNILNEPCPIDRLSNQPVFCHNSFTNYGYHLPVPTCLYHQPYQNPPFTNQVLPMQQPIQMSHGHMPAIITKSCQPILVESNGEVMYNQNNIVPNYVDSSYCDPPIQANHDQPQYVLNPMYNQNHSSRQKILVNRHFSPPQTRRDNWLSHEFNDTDLFFENIATKKIKNQKGISGSTTNMDPYSYFSDIWQTKNTYESSNLKRSLSSEFFFKGPILTNQKFRSIEDANYHQESTCTKICKTNSACSKTKKASNIRKRNTKLRSNCKRKQNNSETKTKNISGNNKTSVKNLKNIDVEIMKEEKMDPEMIEYCKKIEEQKRRREKFLQEKEIRRQQLAMEKVGVKFEPFTGH